MKKEFKSIALIALLFASCTSKTEEQIVGVYAHERSFEDKKLDPEQILGMVSMRDTILITKKEKGYM